jgi:hypothetical protein
MRRSMLRRKPHLRVRYQTSRQLAGATAVGALALLLVLSGCGEDAMGRGESWQVQGQLLAWDGNVWIVDAVPVVVPSAIELDGERRLGARVNAQGRYDQQGRMIADRVMLREGSLPEPTLEAAAHEGPLVGIEGSTWMVGEARVVVDETTPVVTDDGSDGRGLATAGSHVVVEGFRFGEVLIAQQVRVRAAEGQPGETRLRPTEIVQHTLEVSTPQPEQSEPATEQPAPQPPAQPSGESQPPPGDQAQPQEPQPSAPTGSDESSGNESQQEQHPDQDKDSSKKNDDDDDDDDDERERGNGRGEEKRNDNQGNENANDKDKDKDKGKEKSEKKDRDRKRSALPGATDLDSAA